MKKANKDWIGVQCEEIETCLKKKKKKQQQEKYQVVNDLNSEKQGRFSTI